MTTKYQITNHFTEEEINTIKNLIKVSKVSVSLNIISPSEKNKYLSAKNKSELYDYAKSKDIEIERLKKEIQELKKKKISGLGSISPDNTIIVKLKTSIQKLQEKIKDWEYDYEKLEENCKILNEDILSLTKENKENEKYIKELEKENEDKGEELCDFDDIEFNLKKENEKLKKDNHAFTQMSLSLKEENEKLNIRIQKYLTSLKQYQKKSKSPEKKNNHSEIDCETGLQY